VADKPDPVVGVATVTDVVEYDGDSKDCRLAMQKMNVDVDTSVEVT
jgi:hypothetical protein